LHVGYTVGFLLLVGVYHFAHALEHPAWYLGSGLLLVLAAVALYRRPCLPTAALALAVALIFSGLAVRAFLWPIPPDLDPSQRVTYGAHRLEALLFLPTIALSAAHLVYLARRFPHFDKH
jgi:hypothetical protein